MKSLLLLSNYSNTGIGDFGLELRRNLSTSEYQVQFLETSPNGSRLASQIVSILSWPGPLVANVGLTSWGRSGAKNLVGFLSLGGRADVGRKTVIALHNAIEAIDLENSGYTVGYPQIWGAHRAVAALGRAKLVVFSGVMANLLEKEYGLRVSLLSPIPCNPKPREDDARSSPPIVVTPGYISPYKGHAWLPGIKSKVRSPARFVVTGGPHRALSTVKPYQVGFQSLVDSLKAAGIDVMGYLSDKGLDDLLLESRVGLLPYFSTQGASAMFSRLASVGVPVVAPRIPEFQWLDSLGAGILLADPNPDSLSLSVQSLLADDDLHALLRQKQQSFAARYDWNRFLRKFHELL